MSGMLTRHVPGGSIAVPCSTRSEAARHDADGGKVSSSGTSTTVSALCINLSNFGLACQRIQATKDIVYLSACAERSWLTSLDSGVLPESTQHRLDHSLRGRHIFQLNMDVARTPGNCCLADVGLEACLPESLREWSWPRSVVVASPSSFNTGHLSGIYVLDVLAAINSHVRDTHLSFQARELLHAWKGLQISLSLIH